MLTPSSTFGLKITRLWNCSIQKHCHSVLTLTQRSHCAKGIVFPERWKRYLTSRLGTWSASFKMVSFIHSLTQVLLSIYFQYPQELYHNSNLAICALFRYGSGTTRVRSTLIRESKQFKLLALENILPCEYIPWPLCFLLL